MTTHLVTFCDASMSRSAELCIESAKRHGVDAPHYYPASGITGSRYYESHKELLSQPRGCGYWAFKPIILEHLLNATLSLDKEIPLCNDGDVIIYSDAGVEFIDNVNHIIDRMDQDIFLFGNMYEHAHWCKRDIVEEIWPCNKESHCPSPHYEVWDKFGKQVQASVIFFRVNDKTRAFVKEWLDWCLFEGGRLIDDSPSRLPNHPEFQENRHDQAILTTMAYRDGYELHWWPSVYNDGAFTYPKGEYTDDYPALFHHHRKRNVDWERAA